MGFTLPTLLLALGLTAPPADAYVLPDPNIELPILINEAKRAELRELNLFVSDNQGRTWRKIAEAKPNETAFRVNVRNDGLYYFAIQSVDKFGTADPADASKSPKVTKIQVDSKQAAPPPPPAQDAVVPPPDAAFTQNAPNPIVPPPITQANSVAPQGVAPIAPVMPPPIIAPPPVEQPVMPPPPQPIPAPQPQPIAPSQPITPPAPTPNDGPGGFAPLAPMKPGFEPAPKPAVVAPTPPVEPTPATVPSNVQHVRDRQVALDFEVERKGPSGVKKIETWITQDDGMTWQRWSETFETVSPLNVLLPDAERVYGFRMVLYSGVMQSAGPPRQGDAPDVRIQVDRTPPTVAYYAPVPDPTQSNAITLRYSVSDANLNPDSVVLQWSRQATTGWQTIVPTNARPMPSSGVAGMREATWHLPPDLPDAVYLRITARDQAGNVGEFVTREPVTVDLYKPTARIKAVLPTSYRR